VREGHGFEKLPHPDTRGCNSGIRGIARARARGTIQEQIACRNEASVQVIATRFSAGHNFTRLLLLVTVPSRERRRQHGRGEGNNR